MHRTRFALPCLLALTACWYSAAALGASTHTDRVQILVFDAIFTHTRSSGPTPTHAGHRQTAIGLLRTATGRRAGRFSFTCTWTRIKPDEAIERCTGAPWTQDGRLDAAAPRGRTASPTPRRSQAAPAPTATPPARSCCTTSATANRSSPRRSAPRIMRNSTPQPPVGAKRVCSGASLCASCTGNPISSGPGHSG
jgi:hypothetical protein